MLPTKINIYKIAKCVNGSNVYFRKKSQRFFPQEKKNLTPPTPPQEKKKSFTQSAAEIGFKCSKTYLLLSKNKIKVKCM